MEPRPPARRLQPVALSYHLDFGAKAAGYVDAFMEVIRWNNME